MQSASAPSTPRSGLESTPESEYERRIANLDSAPTQSTTEYFSWRHLADLSRKLPELEEQFGTLVALCTGEYVAIGTDGGFVVVMDYLGRVKATLGSSTTAAYGSVAALAFSSDCLVLVAGYSQGFVVVWDWVKGTTVSVSRPLQPADRPETTGHPAGSAITFVGFIGTSKHRFVSGSCGGSVLYHHIVRRLLTTMSTVQLAGSSPGSEVMFETAALPYGSYECPTDDMGLVAVLSSSSLVITKTRHGVSQQYRTVHKSSSARGGTTKHAFTRRPYSGCVAWLPALRYRRTATATDPAEPEHLLPKLAYVWGPDIHVLAVQLDYNVSGNGTSMGNAPPRVRFEKELEWTAVEDVVFCRWVDADTLLYMTQSQRMYVFETDLRQETEVCASPPASIAGRPWITLTTGTEAEPSYSQMISIYRRRVFALCGTTSVYMGRLLSWAERLEILAEQGRFIDAIALATGLYQGRTGQVVVGLPRSRRLGDASQKKRQALVGSRLVDLMRNALASAFGSEDGQYSGDSELQALVTICIEACLALGNMSALFGDVFEYYAAVPARQRIFLETIEPFILSGKITSLPPQVLNAMIDSYGTSPELIQRLGEALMGLNLHPGEFDVDRVVGSCRRHRLWRTFARVWLSMGDPVAPIVSIIAAARRPDTEDPERQAGNDNVGTSFDDEAPGTVIFDYLDMVIRGRRYPDGWPIKPQDRAERYSMLATELIFPPIEASQALCDVQQSFGTLLALLDLGTERLLDTLRHILSDPFIGFVNFIVKPASAQARKDSGRALRRASQVKSFPQIVVDTLYTLAMAAYSEPAASILSTRQIGQLSSFALTLYATRFPLVYLSDEAIQAWGDVLLELNDPSTRAEREGAFEMLFKLYPPRSYSDYVERVRSAGFFRILEHIYRSLDRYEDALRTFLDNPDYAQHRTVFLALDELGAINRPLVAAGIKEFVSNNAVELVKLDAESFARAVGAIPSLSHEFVIDALSALPQLQFSYMRSLLDPATETALRSPGPPALLAADEREPPDLGLSEEQHMVVYPFRSLVPDGAQETSRFPREYHERYLELICQFNPGAVLMDGCVGVCKSALAKLGKDATDRQRTPYLDEDPSTAQQHYRALASSQLCDLWLELLRRALGYLHRTNRTLNELEPDTAAESREAWQLVSSRQRWMLQGALDALISAASPATSFISLRHIIQQLITTGTAAGSEGDGGQPPGTPVPAGGARSLDIAEIQHLLAVAVSAYKTEAQLMALTNVLVDYDLFTTFAQLVRSQKQGWAVPASASAGKLAGGRVRDGRGGGGGELCCGACSDPLFLDQRQEHGMANLRRQVAQYYDSSELRVLDLHVFEDPDAQWQWMKLRTASAAYDEYLGAGTGDNAAGDHGPQTQQQQQQVVLYKCGHGFHRRCIALAGKSLAAAAPPECQRCADGASSVAGSSGGRLGAHRRTVL
ncbi:hypothetical protein GGF46_000741 [Coemansia sp. RSA 552]|nr:hypothetical protein GGF46_000741 [Coemansia sp. RSA 552]